MMRKICIVLGILVTGTIAMAYLYFSNLKNDVKASELSLQAVAAQSSIIFTYDSDDSFYEILSGQELFERILGAKKWKVLQSIQQHLNRKEVQKAINGQRIYIGFVAGEKNEVNFLASTQVKVQFDLLKTLNALKNKVNFKKIGENYQVNFGDSASCFITLKDNLLLLSDSHQTLINNDKAQNNTIKFADYIKQNNRFNKNTLANLYIDFNKVPLLLKQVISSNINDALSLFNKQDGYAALSYNFSKEKLLFNGYTELNSELSYHKLFIDEKEQKISIDQILPNKTANFTYYAINNYQIWREKLNTYFKGIKDLDKNEKTIATLNQKYRLNIDQIFQKHFKNQLITFQLSSGEKFGAIAIDDGDKVKQLLIDLSNNYAPDISVFKDPHILYCYFGQPFKQFERPFFTIIDNYLVFANNASSIQVFLNSYQNDDLLLKTEEYTDFTDQLSSAATICFYVNNKNSTDILSKNLIGPYWKQYKSNRGFAAFNAFCYQLSADNGKFQTNLLLLENSTDATAKSVVD